MKRRRPRLSGKAVQANGGRLKAAQDDVPVKVAAVRLSVDTHTKALEDKVKDLTAQTSAARNKRKKRPSKPPNCSKAWIKQPKIWTQLKMLFPSRLPMLKAPLKPALKP